MKNTRWYWVDENNNGWSKERYSKEKAEELSKTLVNCANCNDCTNCRNCIDCIGCSYCRDCISCGGCSYCRNCYNCNDCTNCIHCSKGCRNCRNCDDCYNCYNCRNCIDCINCRNCIDCRDCSDWKNNPQRIISPKIGSRKDQTIVYFDKERTQVICGCYGDIEDENRTLKDFEEKVKEKYVEGNKYRKEYLAFIEKVKAYIS